MKRNGTVAGTRHDRHSGRRVVHGIGTALVVVTALGLASPSQAASFHRDGTAPAVARSVAGSYIVRADPGQLAALERLLTRRGIAVRQRIAVLDAVVATLSAGGATQLRADPGVASVTRDEAVSMLSTATQTLTEAYSPSSDPGSLYNLTTMTGVRKWWPTSTGAGVDVALVDSGVAPVLGLNAAGKILIGPDLTPESQSTSTANLDTYGHGTHMAGIIAGRDSSANAPSPTDSKSFNGVAPGARIVSVKVADAHGNSDVSQVIAGISWVIEHSKDPGMNIRVLNLSFGTNSTQVYTADPLTYAAEVAWRKGIVVVASAGNGGGQVNDNRLTNPAADPFVIAVAADDLKGTAALGDDTISAFSSRGDGTRNPDISAPGAHLQSLRVPGSYVDHTYGSTGEIDPRFFRGSGTSQAAAFVSGCVALLVQKYPSITPDQVKAMLIANADKLSGAAQQNQGAGLIDMAKLAAATVKPATQNFSPAIGNGSIHAARGNAILNLDGVALTGETDIFGQHYDSVAMAPLLSAGKSWTGGTFNGTAWSGSGWNTTSTTSSTGGTAGWTGRSWAGRSWAGRSWAGRSWAGRSWASGTWSSAGWSAGSWNGASWAGASWAASTWSGRAWADNEWS